MTSFDETIANFPKPKISSFNLCAGLEKNFLVLLRCFHRCFLRNVLLNSTNHFNSDSMNIPKKATLNSENLLSWILSLKNVPNYFGADKLTSLFLQSKFGMLVIFSL